MFCPIHHLPRLAGEGDTCPRCVELQLEAITCEPDKRDRIVDTMTSQGYVLDQSRTRVVLVFARPRSHSRRRTRPLPHVPGFSLSPPPVPAHYTLQTRYQDSGWLALDEEGAIGHLPDAIARAKVLAQDAIAYGMVRVVDDLGRVHHVEAAGGNT